MKSSKVTFPNQQGEQLAGVLDEPDIAPQAYALFAHCFTCTKNLKAVRHFTEAMNAAGLGVLRFDFTGLGNSEGAFEDSNFSSNVSDLHSAVAYLKQQGKAPAILVGHSLGGTAVLQAAASVPSAVAVATIAAPARAIHVQAMLEEDRAEIEAHGEATVQLGGRPFRIKKQFLDDLEKQELPESIAGLRKALLVMHAPLDKIVGIDNASELFQHAKHPKSFVSLDHADHLLSDESDARYAGRVLAAWASAYLPEPAVENSQQLADQPGATVARTGPKGYTTEIVTSGHRLLADEPVSVGGADLGPSPYELLSAALAACTTMTLRMYADRKGLDLQLVSSVTRHAKVHASDCNDCTSEKGRIDEFQRELVLEGNLTEAQRQRMLEIADMCPVHRTLHGEIKVRTSLAPAG